MPTSSDLVTDLPADFEVFGQAVDTSLADLKGGTTDQVLAKNSNTDMDFKWVTSDDANAIQNSIVDAKGDLIAASANDTPARLAVGNNGETLVADSSTSTGLRYQSSYNGNAIINGGMDIFQRSGTPTTGLAVTSTSTSFYGLDRWQVFSASTGRTVSRQVTGDTTNLPNIQYCQRLARDSGNTNTAAILPAYSMESADAIRFAGQTVTLSFFARAGANYSATSNALGFVFRQGTGTDQNLNAGYTGSSDVISSTATLTTTWQRFQATGTMTASSTEAGVQFNFTPTGTAGAADYVEITGVQIERGQIATSFKRSNGAGGTIQGELAACQRYYNRIGYGGGSGNYIATGIGISATRSFQTLGLPVSMRTAPSLAYGSVPAISDTNTSISVTNIFFYAATTGNQQITLDINVASGATQFRPYFLLLGGTGQLIELSAEL